MFVILLGSTLLFSAGLLAAASFSDGALLAVRTAAQAMGWLFVCAVLGAWALRGSRTRAGELSAAMVTLFSGIALVYVSYFLWDARAPDPIRQVVAAEIERQVDLKLIDYSLPAPMLAATSVVVTPSPPKAVNPVVIAPPAPQDTCSSLAGVESLQCRRCANKGGLGLALCNETARLEYCQDRPSDDATCPSAIPYSPPS